MHGRAQRCMHAVSKKTERKDGMKLITEVPTVDWKKGEKVTTEPNEERSGVAWMHVSFLPLWYTYVHITGTNHSSTETLPNPRTSY